MPPKQIAFQLNILKKCTGCFLYYTGKEKVSKKLESMINEHQHIRLYKGRPSLPKIFGWLILRAHPELRVIHDKANLDKKSPRAKAINPVVSLTPAVRSTTSGYYHSQGPNKVTLPSNEVIHEVNEKLVQQVCRSDLSPTDRNAWCVLYCGAIASIRRSLLNASKQSDIAYSEESFSW